LDPGSSPSIKPFLQTGYSGEDIFEAVEKRIARPIGMEEGWRDGQLLYESVSHHPTSGAWMI
jgi:hypothetical protein